MWITREEYEAINQLREELKRVKYLKDCFVDSCEVHKLNYDMVKEENIILKKELEEYKQKYADEVNKRLELIQLIEKKK